MSTDGSTDKPRRRVISVAEKLAHLAAYDEAIQTHQGGAYLRANGLYSSQIVQWRKQRDAGKDAGIYGVKRCAKDHTRKHSEADCSDPCSTGGTYGHSARSDNR